MLICWWCREINQYHASFTPSNIVLAKPLCLAPAFIRLGDLRLELCIDHFHSPYCEPSFWNQSLSPSYAHSNVVLLPPSGWHLDCSLSSEKVTLVVIFSFSQTLLLINRNHFPVCSKNGRYYVSNYWCVSVELWLNAVIHWLLEKKIRNNGSYPCLPWQEQRCRWALLL